MWIEPFEVLRAPPLGNLRTDPFERAEYEGYGYNQWFAEHMFPFAPAGSQQYIGRLARGLDEAPKRGWVFASMRDEWRQVFPDRSGFRQ